MHDGIRDIAGNRNNYERLGEFCVDTGTRLQVTVENLSPDKGLLQTPFWVSLHDGRFEIGREGQSATRFGGLELIAEEGDTPELAARFDSSSTGIDATINSRPTALLTASDLNSSAPFHQIKVSFFDPSGIRIRK